jgi:hypothetical protein
MLSANRRGPISLNSTSKAIGHNTPSPHHSDDLHGGRSNFSVAGKICFFGDERLVLKAVPSSIQCRPSPLRDSDSRPKVAHLLPHGRES